MESALISNEFIPPFAPPISKPREFFAHRDFPERLKSCSDQINVSPKSTESYDSDDEDPSEIDAVLKSLNDDKLFKRARSEEVNIVEDEINEPEYKRCRQFAEDVDEDEYAEYDIETRYGFVTLKPIYAILGAKTLFDREDSDEDIQQDEDEEFDYDVDSADYSDVD